MLTLTHYNLINFVQKCVKSKMIVKNKGWFQQAWTATTATAAATTTTATTTTWHEQLQSWWKTATKHE